jgi:plastocyanin
MAAALSLGIVVGASANATTRAASIRAGDCEIAGPVVAAVPRLLSTTPGMIAPAALRPVADALDGQLFTGTATVPVPLSELAAGDHAISVTSDATGSPNLVLCGELAHFEPGPVDIQVGLAGRDGSSRTGVAWLHDNGDGTTGLTIVVSDPGVSVTIRRSMYRPTPLEIEVGTTVIWTNEDLLPHTVTATEGGFDSGYLAQGGDFSQTFDTPGEFPYYCTFHPRMRARVIVS